MIHFRRWSAGLVVCWQALSINQCATAGRTPVCRGLHFQFGMAMAASPLHTRKILHATALTQP